MRPREVHMPLSQYVAFDRAFARHPVPRIQSQMCRRKERGVDTIEETKGGHQVYAHTRARAPISLYNKVVAYIARFLALARSLSLSSLVVSSSSFVLAYRATYGNFTRTHACAVNSRDGEFRSGR